MAKSKTWLEEITELLVELGGHAYYKDIYEKMQERNSVEFVTNKDWKAQVRGTIERFSSDSEYYNGKTDVFYAVEGIGKGHWGLRDFEPSENNVDITEDDESFSEGKKKLRQHICRERNYKVIKLAKERFKEEHGRLFCEVCNFDFSEKYGDIGEDYIEGHHTIPVSDIPEGYKTKVEDIALVCANCHRMLHRKRPWLKHDKLKELLK